jgi:hypothetical protein
MHVSSATIDFTAWIKPDTLGSAHDPHQRAFGQNLAAAHTGSLRYVFDGFLGWFAHLFSF